MKNKKRYYPIRNAEISLQFYRDKEGTPNFLITSNPQKEGLDFYIGLDSHTFARNLTESTLVSFAELKFFCDFFDMVREKMNTKISKTNSQTTITPTICPVALVNRLLNLLEKK